MIRVMVADDHPLVREGLSLILGGEKDIECVGLAKDGAEAVEMTLELQPDVAIVDVEMPKMDGIEVTKRIKKELPNTAVLILSAYDHEDYIIACMQAGADGYVLKSHTPGEALVSAIHMVSKGSSVLDHEAINLLLKAAVGKTKHSANAGQLGLRELEVLRLAAKGKTNKQIASELKISDQTVGTHFYNIFRKLEVQSRMEAVLHAMRQGWIRDCHDNIPQ